METLEMAKAVLRYWSQYPLPIITTESERIWRQHLIGMRLDLDALAA